MGGAFPSPTPKTLEKKGVLRHTVYILSNCRYLSPHPPNSDIRIYNTVAILTSTEPIPYTPKVAGSSYQRYLIIVIRSLAFPVSNGVYKSYIRVVCYVNR